MAPVLQNRNSLFCCRIFSRSNLTMKTIPDAIDDVKEAWRKIIDTVYKVIEHKSSGLNSWAWRKRWRNRKQGTGYSNVD